MQMDDKEKEILRRAMSGMAALSPDDPLRLELEGKVAAAGEWARIEWLRLLGAEGALRDRLRRVEVPPGLEERLLASARTAGRTHSALRLSRGWLAAAAVLLLALSSAFLLPRLRTSLESGKELKTLALLAVNNHINSQEVSVVTLDPLFLERELGGAVPFRIVLPSVRTGLSLVGGRQCAFGSRPAVYSRWEGPQDKCSLFQFRCSDFGISNQVGKEVIRCEQTGNRAVEGCRCRVIIWSEEGRGYALVTDNTDPLGFLSPDSGK
jgi:hypothetical protein